MCQSPELSEASGAEQAAHPDQVARATERGGAAGPPRFDVYKSERDGVTVVQFNEPASGQTVFHLHYHVIPRHEGVPLMPHNRTMEKPEVLAVHAEKVRKALKP